MPTQIILPEHNSSRLLFIDNQLPDFNLEVVDLEQNSSEKDHCNCSSKFLLGKLNDYVWILEDSGKYDSNHTHQAELKYNNSLTNTTEVMFTINRIMEYSQECDRLYTRHSGGLKIILIDSPSDDQIMELFIKYGRSLPGFEVITDIRNNDTNEVYHGCIVFYKYVNNIPTMYQIVQIIGGINVIDSNTQLPMQNIEYCGITVKSVNINFNRIKFTYSITPNNTNDIKVGYIGTSSLFINPEKQNYGKFISKGYYLNNDNFIEPGCFFIQAPKNRSWICFRNYYSDSSMLSSNVQEIYGYNQSTNRYNFSIKQKNGCKCYNVIMAALSGIKGVLENDKYIYTIDINRNNDHNYYLFMIPLLFNDYESFEYYDNNNTKLINSIDLGSKNFEDQNIYNELDGLFYKLITIPIGLSYCKVYKIKITYNINRV